MKLPLSWIKEFVDVEQVPIEIAKILTMAGIEVESIESVRPRFDKVVVGKILEVRKHPEADKLSIAKVSDGSQIHEVVCGAPNCHAGMKTALALVGATLEEEEGQTFKIKKSKIRGVESNGMLCTGKELRISDDHDGILKFSDHITEGTDVGTLYADTIFEVGLTPNMGYCASILGVGRELAAATRLPLKVQKAQPSEQEEDLIQKSIRVHVEDAADCPRYALRLIRNVKIEPSPEWIRSRLEKCGIRPINNVVDVTNYVLLESGQPLHAFDLNRIQGDEIQVRRAKQDESIKTLDGKERLLEPRDLVIADSRGPIALAGIMGGENTEVLPKTTDILLEAAYFSPSTIRKSSKQLGLLSDSSKRFEKGTDPRMVTEALDKAAALIQLVAHGAVSKGIIDACAQEFKGRQVECRLKRVETLLGLHLGVGEVEDIFKRLGFPTHWNGKDAFIIDVPTYRYDITGEVDLIEEVARLYGYENIPVGATECHPATQDHAPIYLFEKNIRHRLIAAGLQEVVTCDLVGPSILQAVRDTTLPESMLVHVQNPSSVEQSVLRTSLLPGLLLVAKHNDDHQIHDLALFEVGRIHYKKENAYKEKSVAGILLMGKNRPHHWDRKPQEWDFYDLKGIVENFLSLLNVPIPHYRETQLPMLHPGRQAAILLNDLEVGSLAEVHPDVLKRLDIPHRVYFAEVNLHDLFKAREATPRLKEIPIFPGSERDWTITLKDTLPIKKIFDAIAAIPTQYLEKVTLIDLYRSEKLGKGLKNATFRFVYRDVTKTIAQTTVDGEHARILDGVRSQATAGHW